MWLCAPRGQLQKFTTVLQAVLPPQKDYLSQQFATQADALVTLVHSEDLDTLEATGCGSVRQHADVGFGYACRMRLHWKQQLCMELHVARFATLPHCQSQIIRLSHCRFCDLCHVSHAACASV